MAIQINLGESTNWQNRFGETVPKTCRRVLRVRKEDSAFVYFILESHEGVTSYSTMPFEKGQAYRDLELIYTSEWTEEVNQILEDLGDKIYEVEPAQS